MRRRTTPPTLYLIAFAVLTATAAPVVRAATMTYDADGNALNGAQDGTGGGWDTNLLNLAWYNGGAVDLPWTNSTTTIAAFGANNFNSTYTVAVGTVTANGLAFNANTGTGNYTLSGGTITLGGTTPTIAANANATIGSTVNWGSGTAVTINGSQTLTLNASGSLNTSYSGSGIFPSLILSGAGLVFLNAGGTVNMTVQSFLTVKDGATLSQTGGTATAGNFDIGSATNGTVTLSGGTITIGSGNTRTFSIGSNGSVGTLNISGGTLNYAAVNGATSGMLLLGKSGDTVTTGSSTINLTGTGILQTTSGIAYNNGTHTVNLDGGTLKAGSSNFAWNNNANVTAQIGDNGFIFNTNGQGASIGQVLSDKNDGNGIYGTFTKTNSGTLTLSGTNTYSGTTAISAGTLQVTNATGLGSTTGGTTVASGAALDLNAAVGAEAVSIAGTGISSGGALVNSSATAASLAGPVTLTADASVGGNGAGGLTLSGGIGDGGSAYALTKVGTGTLTLSGASTYTGATTVSAGILKAGATNAFAANSAHTVNAMLDLAGFNETIGSLAGSGTVTNTSATAVTLTTNALNNASTTFSGTINQASGIISLTKNGTGTLNLNGANTYTGLLTVNGGYVATNTLTNGGTAGGFGKAGSAASNIILNTGAGLMYTGATLGSTDHGFTMAGSSAYLNAGAAGTFTLTGNLSYAGTGNKTLLLAGTSGAGGILGSSIANNGGSAVGVTMDAISTGFPNSSTFTWSLSGNNTYTGTTFLTRGNVLLAGADSTTTAGPWGVNSQLSFSGNSSYSRIADINNHNVSVGSLNGGGGAGGKLAEIILTSGKALTIGTDNTNQTFSGKITGAGNLTKVSTGNQTLNDASGATTFSGLTTIKNGTLSVSNLASGTSSLGTSAIHFGTETVGGTPKYGILNYTGASAASAHTLALDAAQGTVKVTNSSTNLTLSAGNLSGSGTLIKDGAGTLTLSGNALSGNTGATTISAGTLALDYSGGSLTGNLLSSATVNMNGGDLAVTGRSGAASTQTIADLYLVKTGNLRLTQNSASDLVVDIGTLHRTSGRHLNFSGLTLNTAGQPTNNADTGLGGARIKVDSILKPDGAAQALTPGSKLGDWSLVNGIGWACLDNDTTGGGGAVGDHYIAVAAFYDIYTAATDAAHSIVIQPGQNGFTGPTYVDIRINENGSGGPNYLGAATTTIDSLAMAAGTTAATVAMNHNSASDTLVLGSDAAVGGALAIFSGAKSLTVGQSAGQGSITGTASGNSTLAFMNNNSASTLTVNSAVKDNGSASVAVEVSGNGNGETTVLAGANTYTGGTTVDGNATLRLTGVGTLGAAAGTLAVETGSTLDIQATGGVTLGGAVTGGGTIKASGGAGATTTVSGNAGGFTGAWTLNGTNAANTLYVDNAGGLGGTTNDAATVTFATANGGTLRFGANAGSGVYGNVVVAGSGANAMRMAVAANTSVNFNGTLDATNTGGLAVGISGSTGTLALSGSNSYAGATAVNFGTLLVNGSHTADGTAAGAAVSGAYTVADGARIGGTGLIRTTGAFTMQGGAASTAQITGGDFGSIGTLTLDGASNRTLAGTYLFDVNYSQFTVGSPVNCSPSGTAADLIEVTGMTSGTLDLTDLKFGLGTQSGTLAAGRGYAVKLLEWDAGTTLSGAIGDGASLAAGKTVGLLAGQSIVRWGNAYYLVPEPASFALLSLGSLLLLRRPSRRRRP